MMNDNLKIGVLFTAYNCAEYVQYCLNPWFNLKNTFNFKFAINSGMFKAYKDLGHPDRNSETLNAIYKYRFDYLINTKDSLLLDEDGSRNSCLNYLKDIQGCDLIWLVDADEVYKENEIINTINYIRQNSSPDWYSTSFRNYTFDKNYHLDFERPNIYWTNRNDGIDRFYFDSHVLYKDGNLYNKKIGTHIPKTVLFIDHYSWLTNDTRSVEKIEYQKNRHHGDIDIKCSYLYKNKELFFNKSFYEKRRVNYPTLHEFTNSIDNRISIEYDFYEKKLIIRPSEEINSATFKIYDSKNNLILNWSTYVTNPLTYWHDVDLDGSYTFEMYCDSKLAHLQKIHINTKMTNYD